MTSGLEVTLLILSRMYRCGIMVIRSDFVWLPHNIKPELCPIIIVQNATGQFMGTHVKKPLYVGEFVESFACIRSKKPIVTSTLQRDGSIGYFGPSAQEDLSPIAEVSTTNTSTELLHQEVAKFEEKCVTEKSDSGEGDDYDSKEDDDNEDDEESEDSSEGSHKSGNTSGNGDSESKEEFEPGSDDDEYESESTDLVAKNVGLTRATVNTDCEKNDQSNKSVYLRIEDISFTDSSLNKDVNNSKTTADLSATADVTITDPNTDTDMLASGGNFVTRNPERSATVIDFPQYNGEKEMGLTINILSYKIESAGKKESSDIDIPPDMNEMEFLDDDHMDEDPLEGQNESDVEKLVQAEEQKNDSDKSTPNKVDKGDENEASEQINTNDSVSDTNPVDGEECRVKKSEPVVIIKYGCKKCTKICYTESGYHTHLFRAHRIRNVNYYPAQIIEGTMVNSADVHVSRFGAKEEPKYPCDECGQLFFHESSIETHKTHTHRASRDDDTDGVQNKSAVTEDNKKDEDEEKLEKGRKILNTMICKPGSKKKPKMSQRKPRSPCKISKGMKKTALRRSARIANSSQETIDNESTVISDETKSASEIEKMLPDINLPRRITRSTRKESKVENEDDNETTPATNKSELTNVSSGRKCTSKSQVSADSATKTDPTDHPSPASVLRKISRIVTRSQTTEDDVEKKESINVPKKTELDNKPTHRITRSQNVVSIGDLSQPSVMENEPQRMRTRSQLSEKSENSLQASKNLDNSHDATLDVTVSLLNMNIDGQKKYIVSCLRE